MRRGMKILQTLFAGFTLMSISGYAAPLNDLGPRESVKLDLVVKIIETDKREAGIFYNVDTPYSNPVICSVDVPIPVLRGDHSKGIFEVSQSDVVIFPRGEFSKQSAYRIDNSRLGENSQPEIGADSTYKNAAFCEGWQLGDRLPHRACLTLNPNHDESCCLVLQAGSTYYPIVRHGLHLGDCGC